MSAPGAYTFACLVCACCRCLNTANRLYELSGVISVNRWVSVIIGVVSVYVTNLNLKRTYNGSDGIDHTGSSYCIFMRHVAFALTGRLVITTCCGGDCDAGAPL